MNIKQELGEIKFALDHGHTNFKMGTEIDGTFYIWGTFGYIATSDLEFINAIKTLVAPYTAEEVKEEVTEEVTENLTAKEKKVLNSLVENTYEYGLPVEVDEIKADTKMSKRSIVGVISSLYKKGFVESYDVNHADEFMLSEKWYKKLLAE